MPEGSPRKHRILISTDAPQDVRIVEGALTGFCRLTIVPSEAALMEEMENGLVPDLLLLTVRTPEMDGYEACRRITGDSRWTGVPIVLLGTRTEAIDKPKVYEVGAVDYISQPLEVDEIRARISTQLEATSRCAEVERRNREKEELLHILSHDLSGTLTIVVWALDLLKGDPSRFDKLEKTMQSAATNGFALIDIVQQLRLAEEKPPELGPVNLKYAVENSLSLLENQIREKDISLQVMIDDSTIVVAEEISLVNAVLKDILLNAVKFSEPGSGVQVSVRRPWRDVSWTRTVVSLRSLQCPPEILPMNMERPSRFGCSRRL